jgi:hypothetical protein
MEVTEMQQSSALKKFVREPLVHFLALGALLFLYFHYSGGGAGPSTKRIVITTGQIEHLASGFAGTWQRPPTESELKGLVDEYVKEEIAIREAVSMGLDRDDTIIRRRLRQKFEFLAEDALSAVAPTEAELQAWMVQHPDTFKTDPKVAFRQVYVNPERHRGSARADAEKILSRLRAGGPNVATDNVGDTTMLPAEQRLASVFETTRTFGEEFSQELLKLEPGQWTGPIESSFGLHLVFVREKVAPQQLRLAEVRQLVEREVSSEKRKRQLQELYEKLLKNYSVTIEHPKIPMSQAGGEKK